MYSYHIDGYTILFHQIKLYIMTDFVCIQCNLICDASEASPIPSICLTCYDEDYGDGPVETEIPF
jgi:hypothetical protein